jgi:hypothetical protein
VRVSFCNRRVSKHQKTESKRRDSNSSVVEFGRNSTFYLRVIGPIIID